MSPPREVVDLMARTGRIYVSGTFSVLLVLAALASGALIGALYGYARAKGEDAAVLREAARTLRETTEELHRFAHPGAREEALDL